MAGKNSYICERIDEITKEKRRLLIEVYQTLGERRDGHWRDVGSGGPRPSDEALVRLIGKPKIVKVNILNVIKHKDELWKLPELAQHVTDWRNRYKLESESYQARLEKLERVTQKAKDDAVLGHDSAKVLEAFQKMSF